MEMNYKLKGNVYCDEQSRRGQNGMTESRPYVNKDTEVDVRSDKE